MQNKRELFIYRIASGEIKYKGLTIKRPDVYLTRDAVEIYTKVFNHCKKQNIPTEEELVYKMIEFGVWDIDKEKRLMDDSVLRSLKIDLYNNRLRSLHAKGIKEKIRQIEQDKIELFKIRHQLDHFTCEGIANYYKIQFLVKNTTYKQRKKYKFKKINLEEVVNFVNGQFISEKELRDIVKNEPWKEIWAANRKNRTFLFAENGLDLTTDQRRLIMWSSLYDNVRECEDCPADFVIYDDDLFDGWLLSKNKKGGKQDGDKNGQEIFIPVDTVEDAKRVSEMNSYEANLIKQARLNKVRKEQHVKEGALPDIKRELQLEINRRRNG